MLYFIYGEDNFLSDMRLKEVLSFYLKNKPHFINYDLSEENLDINKLRGILLSKSLYSSIRVVLIKNIFQIKDENSLENVLETLKEGQLNKKKDTLVIFYENNKVEKNKLRDWLIKNSFKVEEYNFLTDLKLINWIKKQEEKLKINLKKDARDLLILSLENNTRAIFNALITLSRFKNKIITREFLEKNINLPIKTNIFEFLDNLSLKKISNAYKLLKQEIESGSNPLYLLKMIINQFRNLLKIKSLKSITFYPSANLKMHPYVYKKLIPLSKNYSFEELKRIYSRLLFYDRKIKDGSLDPEIALELFILDLKKKN